MAKSYRPVGSKYIDISGIYNETFPMSNYCLKNGIYESIVDLSSLSSSNYYPVRANKTLPTNYGGVKFSARNIWEFTATFSSRSDNNIAAICEGEVWGCAWGQQPGTMHTKRRYSNHTANNVRVVDARQMSNSSTFYFYLKGGTKYRVGLSYPTEWTIVTDSYTINEQTIAPITDLGNVPNIYRPDIPPVGSLYFADNSTNPGDIFGGTWERIVSRYIYATSGTSGSQTSITGSAAQSHTLTVDEIPSHNHKVTDSTTSYASGSQSGWRCLSWSGTSHDYWEDVWSGYSGGGGGHSHDIAHYSAIVWRRTA